MTKTNWHAANAWRTAREPEAITEALKMGEQIFGLLIQAIALIEDAYRNVDPIIGDSAALRCEVIVDQLIREITRLAPLLIRLRAASKAAIS